MISLLNCGGVICAQLRVHLVQAMHFPAAWTLTQPPTSSRVPWLFFQWRTRKNYLRAHFPLALSSVYSMDSLSVTTQLFKTKCIPSYCTVRIYKHWDDSPSYNWNVRNVSNWLEPDYMFNNKQQNLTFHFECILIRFIETFYSTFQLSFLLDVPAFWVRNL